MKKLQLEEIRKQKKIESYQELYDFVARQVEQRVYKPVKASGWNGKKPPLYNAYWLEEAKKDYSHLVEELKYALRTDISIDYYLAHLEEYEKDRDYVLSLNEYLGEKEKLQIPMSQNERCFDIWQQEKFLSQGPGKKICNRCGVELSKLAFYETYEPLAYYAMNRKVPQNILIIENKDTFFTMRRLMLKGQNIFWGVEIDTLIYGAGKGIVKAFQGLELSGEDYMLEAENVFYYFGDLDYEGIQIYQSLIDAVGEVREIIPFREAYECMLQKCNCYKNDPPKTKAGQKRKLREKFLTYFDLKIQNQIKELLEQGLYLPQECINEVDL